MTSFDPALFVALKAVPAPHRRHLISRITQYPKGVRNDDARLHVVASRMPKDALKHYAGLYREHGGVIDWRIQRDVTVSAEDIQKRLTHTYPHVLQGLRPTLEQHQPPKLHKIAPQFGGLDVTYAMWSKERLVMDGYGDVRTSPPAFFAHDAPRRSVHDRDATRRSQSAEQSR